MERKITVDTNKIILVILVILMILPSSFTFLPISIFKLSTIIILIIFIYLFINNRENIKKALKNKFVLCNFLFSIVIFLSLIKNFDTVKFNDTFEVLKYIIFPIVTLLIFSICEKKQYYNFLLKTISTVMIIICFFSIIQYFNPFSINELYIKTYAPTQYETLVGNYPSPRIVGVKSNPAVYGIFVSLGIYFNIIYYKHAKNKSICVLSILLCIINLILTLTRTIQIAFLASIIVFTLISVLLKKGCKKAIIATGIAIGGILLLLLILPESLTWRLTQVIDFSNATSWIGRVSKWKDYTDIIKQNLFLGVGPVKNHVQQIGYVDSELIQNILQYGILGFAVYIGMILSPIYIYIKEKTNKNILIYYIPILILILINNIASTSLMLSETAIGYYMILGIILASCNKEYEGSEKN